MQKYPYTDHSFTSKRTQLKNVIFQVIAMNELHKH